MKLGKQGSDLIKKLEGCRLYWYDLKDGGLTCGYGRYITYETAKKKGIKVNDRITQKQADDFFNEDVQKFVNYTNIALQEYPFKVNQNQFDALVSYCYNRGLGNKSGTNGLRQLLKNSKTTKDISDNLIKYWGTATTYRNGLLNRRKREKELFDTPIKKDKLVIDGVMGMNTIKQLQKFLKVDADGVMGKETIKALQRFLNSQ